MKRATAPMTRDAFLDYLRGFAMVWVVLVHVFYHKDFFPYATLKSFILFEMPLIFFISGASLLQSHRRDPSWRRFIPRRLERLLVPYALLGLFSIALFYGAAIAQGQPVDSGQLLSWLVLFPVDTAVPYIGWYMWFMRVMLVVSILHLPLVRAFEHKRLSWIVPMLLIGLLVLFSVYGRDPLGLPQLTVFYSIFLYWGYAYGGGGVWRNRYVQMAGILGGAALLLAMLLAGIFPVDMQANKFPPNLAYGVFGFAWLMVFLLGRNKIGGLMERFHPARRFLLFFGEHSYAVYLWHGVGFWLIDRALVLSGVNDAVVRAPDVLPMLLYFLVNLPLTALLALTAERLTSFLTSSVRRALGRWMATAVPTPLPEASGAPVPVHIGRKARPQGRGNRVTPKR
ncbi:MAG: acyltransferase [Dehalococcoidia bacterium]|nr:acyltransferase [Dehalococcoidia bacterium]